MKQLRVTVGACLLGLCASTTGLAQAPCPAPTLQHAGRLSHADGTPVDTSAGGPVVVHFRIYDAATGGTLLWSEEHALAVRGGFFAVELGTQVALPATLTGSTCAERFLGVEVGAEGEMQPRHRIVPALYATVAATAENVTGHITPSAVTTGAASVTGDAQVAGRLDALGGLRLGNPEPCGPAHAGTLRWTGAQFEGCDGAAWRALGAGGGPDTSFHATSTRTCLQLGWATAGGTAECGEADIPGCNYDKSWFEARDLCQGLGARLCTRDEIVAGAAMGTGCSVDSMLVWTSTSCSGGAGRTLVLGSAAAAGVEETCETNLFATFASGNPRQIGVRCCGDLPPPTFATTSAKTCAQLGFSCCGGGSAECGEAETPTCQQNVTWYNARDACELIGARLCTAAEIAAGAAAGSGCSHDSRMVWTSTPCGEGGMLQVVGNVSSSGNLQHCSEDLLSPSTPVGPVAETAIRCCGDN